MNATMILDCTLRDGGYVNKWRFGADNIREIIRLLVSSNVDIIECGFLRDAVADGNMSVFSQVSQIEEYIFPKRRGTMYVAMIALGEFCIKKVPDITKNGIDGIRLSFHKHDWQLAKEAVRALIEKGYKVFVQPVGTTSYSDEELLRLIYDINSLKPYAFYLVDTLGILYKNEMQRLIYLIEYNLNEEICIGFHSHNNLQLSFSNAQYFMELVRKHCVIIDAAVYGMGRGVGNLSTELITEYINKNFSKKYEVLPILEIADRYLSPIYAGQRWGYDLPYYLSAVEESHPNYATYLVEKGTLDIISISRILSSIPIEKRALFDDQLIEKIYLSFQDCKVDDSEVLRQISDYIFNRNILLIAPGATMNTHQEAILDTINIEEPIIFTVNFLPQSIRPDIVFISNRRRLDQSIKRAEDSHKLIATSNLKNFIGDDYLVVNYSSYLGEGEASDNAGAMLIRLLRRCNAKKIFLAGFDGFDVDSQDSYCVEELRKPMNKYEAQRKNLMISQQLRLALNDVEFHIVTPTRYKL